jgi:hypothetical protein
MKQWNLENLFRIWLGAFGLGSLSIYAFGGDGRTSVGAGLVVSHVVLGLVVVVVILFEWLEKK